MVGPWLRENPRVHHDGQRRRLQGWRFLCGSPAGRLCSWQGLWSAHRECRCGAWEEEPRGHHSCPLPRRSEVVQVRQLRLFCPRMSHVVCDGAPQLLTAVACCTEHRKQFTVHRDSGSPSIRITHHGRSATHVSWGASSIVLDTPGSDCDGDGDAGGSVVGGESTPCVDEAGRPFCDVDADASVEACGVTFRVCCTCACATPPRVAIANPVVCVNACVNVCVRACAL